MLGSRLNILRPGRLPYEDAAELQRRVAMTVAAGGDPTLILLEHPPTYTLGRRADPAHIITDPARLAALGAAVIQTDRGGDVTFHGPGQLVGYPILDLKRIGMSVADYVTSLEQCLIDALAGFAIEGARSPLNRGVWVRGSKIAAIGVHVARGVTTHGFALNVTTDLAWFDHIVPCGIAAGVTSIERESGRLHAMAEVEDAVTASFRRTLGSPVRVLAEVAS